jgi:hypothetical protein
MAPNIRVPEGYVFVPRQRGVNVALQLIEAADKVKANRHESVRTVSGGYHVTQEVADAYQAALPEVDDNDASTETDEEKAAREAAEAEAAAKAEAEAAAKAEAEKRGYPDGDPNGDWTVKQLEAWAEARDPKVDLGSGNKESKLQVALDSLKS